MTGEFASNKQRITLPLHAYPFDLFSSGDGDAYVPVVSVARSNEKLLPQQTFDLLMILLAAILERADTSSSVVDALFTRSDSRRAASTFMKWFFKEKGGQATKEEMSR